MLVNLRRVSLLLSDIVYNCNLCLYLFSLFALNACQCLMLSLLSLCTAPALCHCQLTFCVSTTSVCICFLANDCPYPCLMYVCLLFCPAFCVCIFCLLFMFCNTAKPLFEMCWFYMGIAQIALDTPPLSNGQTWKKAPQTILASLYPPPPYVQ